MELDKIKDIRSELSTLWIVVMLNMIFADIFTIIVALVDKSILTEMPGDVITVMAVAAIITSILIAMIYLVKILPYKLNKYLNIIVAIFTILYIIGGASLLPHYIIIASIEVIVLIFIIIKSWKWKI